MSTLEKFCPWRVQCICINFAVMVVKSKANALQKAIKNRSRRGDCSYLSHFIVPFPSTVIVQFTSSCYCKQVQVFWCSLNFLTAWIINVSAQRDIQDLWLGLPSCRPALLSSIFWSFIRVSSIIWSLFLVVLELDKGKDRSKMGARVYNSGFQNMIILSCYLLRVWMVSV